MDLKEIFSENYKRRATYFSYNDINREIVYIFDTKLANCANNIFMLYSSLLVDEIIPVQDLFEIDIILLSILKNCDYDENLYLLDINIKSDLIDFLKIAEKAENYCMCHNIHTYINKLFIDDIR